MEELRSRLDSSDAGDSVMPSPGFRSRLRPARLMRSLPSGLLDGSSSVPYLLHSSTAWLVLRGYHVWCMVVGLCIVLVMLVEVFLNEYVNFFSNPWVAATKAESMCIAAASLTSVLLLSWSSHLCHTGVLLVVDAARDDSFLVFRSLFRLARINSRTALPSGSMSMLRSGHPFWKCVDLVVQICIFGSLDVLPFLVALGTGHASDWLTCVAWVSFCQMAIFWLLVCINDYVAKYYAFRRLCLEHPPGPSLPTAEFWTQSIRTEAGLPLSPTTDSSPRCRHDSGFYAGWLAKCSQCANNALQALFPREGQRLSMVIPYAEHWEIDLRNFMAGRRAEDYRIEDRIGHVTSVADLEHLRADQFPLQVYRLEDAPSPNLCLIWCDWLHRQSSRVTFCSMLFFVLMALGALWAHQMLLIVLATILFFACILHLLRKHCVMARSAHRTLVIRTEEERLRLLEVLDSELCLKEAVRISGTELPCGSQVVDDVAAGKAGMDSYLRKTPLARYSMSLVVAVRLNALDPWSVFWETFCGCSPDHIIQGCILYLVCGLVICIVLFYTKYYAEGICGLLLLAVLASPAVGLKAFPENARSCHVAVCLFLAALALIFTFCATKSPALVARSCILCVFSQCLLPRKLHRLRRISLCFTILLTLLLSTFISVSLSALVKRDLYTHHFDHRKFHFPKDGQMIYWGAENFTAAACSITYGTTDETVNLQLVDFGLFNKLVYLVDHQLEQHLHHWLPQWELVKQQRREHRCVPRDEDCEIGDWTSWFVFQGRRGTKLENTSVVTIRGTKTPLDYILDLDLWSGALMQQVFSNLLLTGPPVNAFLNSETARHWFKGKKVHYASVWKYLHFQHLRHHPEKLMYITGHSLGGGIANLLGAEFGLPSIAFSPPGVHSTAQMLEIDPVRLQALALDIIPDNDPVVRTGYHGTVQLPIACADHFPMCHRIFNSVCELFDTCGDQAQPPRELPCDFCPAKLKQRPGLAPNCGHKH